MSDTVTSEADTEAERISSLTKKGFDLQERMKNRGLRKATITLYLDEETGPELGWAYDEKNAMGAVTGRVREGVLGELDALTEERESARKTHQSLVEQGKAAGTENENENEFDSSPFDERIAELEAKRDELIAELTKTGIVVNIRAVPPVIQKDCRRKAKATVGIETKGVPDDLQEEFNLAYTAHLMSVMIQTVTDNESGEVNHGVTYDDAIAMMDYLPPAQFSRLDRVMGEVQFTDAISLSIESQEDFS